MIDNRCSRIADLLLIENEVEKIENSSTAVCIKDTAFTNWDYLNSKGITLSPIEKIMYAILSRITDAFYCTYSGYGELGFGCQKEIGNYRVDFLVTATFSDTQVIIECDGHDFHEKTKEQAKHDKERDRYFTSLGYKVLHYTGSEIYNNFMGIEKELKHLLDVPVAGSLFEEKK